LIGESLVVEYQTGDPHHHYVYSDSVFHTEFVSSQVSDFDCFHPSAEGQRDLAAATWADGPFAVPEPSGALPAVLGVVALVFLSDSRARRRAAAPGFQDRGLRVRVSAATIVRAARPSAVAPSSGTT
jgi:hypothetical protein